MTMTKMEQDLENEDLKNSWQDILNIQKKMDLEGRTEYNQEEGSMILQHYEMVSQMYRKMLEERKQKADAGQ